MREGHFRPVSYEQKLVPADRVEDASGLYTTAGFHQIKTRDRHPLKTGRSLTAVSDLPSLCTGEDIESIRRSVELIEVLGVQRRDAIFECAPEFSVRFNRVAPACVEPYSGRDYAQTSREDCDLSSDLHRRTLLAEPIIDLGAADYNPQTSQSISKVSE